MSNSREQIIKDLAQDHGFLLCRIATVDHLKEQEEYLKDWLDAGKHGNMSYMENNKDLRVNPRNIVSGANSVICLALNYFTERTQVDPDAPRVSKYAYGRDYHKVIKKKLKSLAKDIELGIGVNNNRMFVDSAPVLEREWARRAGIGWVGKNTMVINQSHGSYFFLAEIITDLELEPDKPVTDHCGTCTKCIDACPTDALTNPYEMDGSKCISYATIELKPENPIPDFFKGKMDGYAFGCDICQEVCPWNRFSSEHEVDDFHPTSNLLGLSKSNWANMTEEEFDNLFEGSAVKRTKFEGLKRNVDFLS